MSPLLLCPPVFQYSMYFLLEIFLIAVTPCPYLKLKHCIEREQIAVDVGRRRGHGGNTREQLL